MPAPFQIAHCALLGACGSTFVNFGDPRGLFGVSSVTDDSFSGEGKLATIDVYDAEITFCDPASWEDLDESRVVLDDEPLRVRIDAWPCMTSAAQIKSIFGSTFTISTDSTCPGGANIDIPLDASFATDGSAGQIRMEFPRAELVANGLLPSQNEDGIEEKATIDSGDYDQEDDSTLLDSTAFNAIAGVSRHDATSLGNMDNQPPSSLGNRYFFSAAGVEYILATYFTKSSKFRQIMNQADYFYFSGHGHHAHAALECPSGEGVVPSDVKSYWTNDLECVIFAGCSVLDIGDFVSKRLSWRELAKWKAAGGACSPGNRWRNIGPKIFLGYGWTAPLDTQGSDEIAAICAAQINSGQNPVEAWRIANDRPAGRNACAIDMSVSPARYWHWQRNLLGGYTWTCKTEGTDW